MKEIIKRLKELGEYLGDTCSGNEVMDIKYNLEAAIAKQESDSELLDDIAIEAHTMGRLYSRGGEKLNPADEIRNVTDMIKLKQARKE